MSALDRVSPVANTRATRDRGGDRLFRGFDPCSRYNGAHVKSLVITAANPQLNGAIRESGDKLVEQRLLDDLPVPVHHWPAQLNPTDQGSFNRFIDLPVCQHKQGIFSAHLELESDVSAGGAVGDCTPRAGRAGE